MEDYDLVHFETEPGDVLVHHYRTIHGAGGNTTRYQVRRAASLRYCGDDIRFKTRPWAPKQLHHTHRLDDGDPLSGSRLSRRVDQVQGRGSGLGTPLANPEQGVNA